MVICRVIKWEGSHLVQMVDLRKNPPLVGNMGLDIESMRDIYCNRSHLVQTVELEWDNLMVDHMVVEVSSLRYLQWEYNW